MQETWKDIPKFEGYYQVSNFGRVRSLDKTIAGKDGRIMSFKGMICKTPPKSNGYLRKRLKNGSLQKEFVVHRGVARLFLSNPNNYKEINHLDGNKLNNRADNLEWCTRKENVRHAWENGLMKSCKKLTKEQVISIRKKSSDGISNSVLAKENSVTVQNIYAIVNRRSWKWI